MPATARRLLPVILGLLLFGFALHVLRAELHAVSWHDLSIDIRELPPSRFLLAVGLTWINYAVLTGTTFSRSRTLTGARRGSTLRSPRFCRTRSPTTSASRCSRARRCAIGSTHAGGSAEKSSRESFFRTR